VTAPPCQNRNPGPIRLDLLVRLAEPGGAFSAASGGCLGGPRTSIFACSGVVARPQPPIGVAAPAGVCPTHRPAPAQPFVLRRLGGDRARAGAPGEPNNGRRFAAASCWRLQGDTTAAPAWSHLAGLSGEQSLLEEPAPLRRPVMPGIPSAPAPMAPLPPPRAVHTTWNTTAALQARKIRFEAQAGGAAVGVEGTYGIIRHPAPPWRCRSSTTAGW